MEDKQSSKKRKLKNKDSIDSDNANNEDKIELDEKKWKNNFDIQKQIVLLEKTNKDLKNKVESLRKNQKFNNNVLDRLASFDLRKKFELKNSNDNDSIKWAMINKEKNELQEINEKMLYMLTEKELENDDLNEKFENFKLEVKIQNKELVDKIKQKEEGDLSKKLSDIIKEENNNEKNSEEKIEDINKYKDDLDFYKKKINH